MSRVQMKAVIPPGTSTEQAVEIVATSDWAQNIARAQASIALFGTPEPPAQMSPEERAIYERLVKNYARYVAMGFLGLR
ncbi:MAG: hypothetical protein DRI01_04555 [Chloroflexi bacterium]|nr:MAG: hypothetical protein DRI01_04555 [Chloroflexota bacterium]